MQSSQSLNSFSQWYQSVFQYLDPASVFVSLWGNSVPEEDVPGLTGRVGVNQLLLELLQRTVVDIDWTL